MLFALPDNYFSSFNTDIGILAYKLGESKVGLKGWTMKIHFINESHIVNFGYGDRLAIESSNMLPIDSLQEVADKLRKKELNDYPKKSSKFLFCPR